MDTCIKKQWRIYPVAPLIARQIYKPINLLHHDPRQFPDPHIYRPERFLPDSPKLPLYNFIPFSAKSRNRIGSRFATSVIKVAVLSVLKAFRVEAFDTEDQLRFISELELRDHIMFPTERSAVLNTVARGIMERPTSLQGGAISNLLDKASIEKLANTLGTTEVTLQNIHKLTWLDTCIKEQWRIYPVAPLIARQIYKPINLMGNEIPPGSTVLINSYLLHRDPRHFPDPHIYRPERFLPDSPKLPPYTFIPLSAGSRNCIGSRFATSVIKVAVLSVLKAFRVEACDTEDQLRFISELVLLNANGLRLKITPH
ncbi:Cytochrome P450 4c3 [Camponotus floridanus]|uniref:Cytochrome P450 4c3 n=1 Tax=Camponotus floridanus TaxID=104421 RepID=E2AIJ5_CAMFO|nr:Cytochrome P450 4c3 [Camponotus floridanus]